MISRSISNEGLGPTFCDDLNLFFMLNLTQRIPCVQVVVTTLVGGGLGRPSDTVHPNLTVFRTTAVRMANMLAYVRSKPKRKSQEEKLFAEIK